MLVVSPATGCGSKPAPEPVAPIAACVGEEEQRTNGITLKGADGDTVDALMYGTGDAGVVFANQVDGDLCQWQWHAQTLAQQGFRTTVFNYSSTAGPDADVLAAVATLRGRGANRIFLIGASKGGTAVLAAAAKAAPPVSGVVSLSGPAAFANIDAADDMASFSTPVVFIAGENDGAFASDARALYRACAAKDKKLEILPTGNHGVGLVDADVFRLIQDFMAGH
jgi:pimeloyl-ACP methyl ester carboxylesterase